jgi:hypothetical protein
VTTNLIFTMLICGAVGMSVTGVIDGVGDRVTGRGHWRLRLWTVMLLINAIILAFRITGSYLV